MPRAAAGHTVTTSLPRHTVKRSVVAAAILATLDGLALLLRLRLVLGRRDLGLLRLRLVFGRICGDVLDFGLGDGLVGCLGDAGILLVWCLLSVKGLDSRLGHDLRVGLGLVLGLGLVDVCGGDDGDCLRLVLGLGLVLGLEG